MECLIKSGYKNGILHRYRKLLEGFADDEKFKDMIPILEYGSSTRAGEGEVASEYLNEEENDNKAI